MSQSQKTNSQTVSNLYKSRKVILDLAKRRGFSVEDYNNFIYEDEEDGSDENNKIQNDILEKEIQDCDTIIKEAENEYNKKLQLLNEQEQLLISKKNQIEELKKKKNNNEKHLNL